MSLFLFYVDVRKTGGATLTKSTVCILQSDPQGQEKGVEGQKKYLCQSERKEKGVDMRRNVNL